MTKHFNLALLACVLSATDADSNLRGLIERVPFRVIPTSTSDLKTPVGDEHRRLWARPMLRNLRGTMADQAGVSPLEIFLVVLAITGCVGVYGVCMKHANSNPPDQAEGSP
jgi:hypothetical protein